VGSQEPVEREIGRFVYQFYGLTPEEIAVVEGAAGASDFMTP